VEIGNLTGIRQITALPRLRLSLSTDFGEAKSSTRGLLCFQASDIGAASGENADFVVIQTNVSRGF
jgi:hypothetical protein